MRKLIAGLLVVCIFPFHHLLGQSNAPAKDDKSSGTFQAQGNLPSIDPIPKSENPIPSASVDQGVDGITWDGKNFKITDIRILDSKFSAYLNEPEVSYAEEKEYTAIIYQILDKLDVFAIRQKGKSLLDEVLPLLAKAARHPRDGGICRQIYNAVGVDVQSKDSAYSKKLRMKELEKEIDTLKWNMSVIAKPSPLDVRPQATDSGSYFQYEEAQREKKTRLAFMQNELENKFSELRETQSSLLSKTEDARFALQGLVTANFLARRFDHVMIVTSLYRLLYPDGSSELKLQEKVISEAAENAKRLRSATSFDKTETTSEQMGFGSGGVYSNKTVTRANKEDGITSMLPTATGTLDSITAAKTKFASLMPDTMTGFEIASQEAIDQCNRYISAVRGHIVNQELDNATERLREAFAFGEQLASIRSFPRESKQLLWKYKKVLKEARAGLASKDLGKAKEAIAKIDQMTTDSPLSKEGSEIGNVETISAMHLAKAKEAASRGDRDSMNKELEEAAKAWPQNPSLASATSKIIEQLDLQSQNKTELRKLIEQKNYKYIFEEKARFLASAADDSKLLSDLNQVLQAHSSVLGYCGKAEELLKRNDAFGAWEAAEEGVQKYPESPELLKIRSESAMKVPEFVKEIEKGRLCMEKQDPLSALCAFLAARRIYPNSVFAKEGISKSTEKALSF